jgi:transposase
VVVERIEQAGSGVVIWARSTAQDGACPSCAHRSGRVHSRYDRRLVDAAVAAQPVILRLHVRRFFCGNPDCPAGTFAEQVTGVTTPHARRTVLCRKACEHIGLALAGRAGARLAARLGFVASRSTLLRAVHALPDPGIGQIEVLGVDDFALARGHRYATVLIDALTHRRLDVLPDRTAATLTAWLRAHPGIKVVCRDGSATYAEGIRAGAPNAVQVSDRWHLWHGLAEAAQKEVAAHSACWAKAGPPPKSGPRAQTTAERWQQVHALLSKGTGLLECARRLDLSLNTVKRYARATQPERLQRAPQYRATLVDPYREHLRKRRAENPAVPVQQLLREIRELGYPGSSNLLVRYITQGRVGADRPHLSPRRTARLLLTRPADLTGSQTALLASITAACPEMTALAGLVRSFAALLVPDLANAGLLQQWIAAARAAGLPHLHAFCNGLDLDLQAATTALTLPHHNGRTEGVNTKTKMIKRQMYGRAGFTLLRHRILLG